MDASFAEAGGWVVSQVGAEGGVDWRGPTFPKLEGQQANSELVPTSKSRIAEHGGSGATLPGSSHSHLCDVGQATSPLCAQLGHGISRAAINVYLGRLLRQLTTNPQDQRVRAGAEVRTQGSFPQRSSVSEGSPGLPPAPFPFWASVLPSSG